MEIKVLSINTWKCDGQYLARMAQLQRELLPLDLDFIACQEVFQTVDQSYSTVEFLANSLNRTPIWFPSRLKERIIGHQPMLSYSGLCLLTKHEPIEVYPLHLPSDPRDGERTAQCVVFDLNGQRVLLINTHLTHLIDAVDLRLNQMLCIIEQIKQIKDLAAYILCGDLNTVPNSAPIQYLFDELPETKNVFVEPFPPTHISGESIDYIFYAPYPKLQLLNKRIIWDKPINGLRISDHYGLFAHLKVNNI